jgi:hypothetical protein
MSREVAVVDLDQQVQFVDFSIALPQGGLLLFNRGDDLTQHLLQRGRIVRQGGEVVRCDRPGLQGCLDLPGRRSRPHPIHWHSPVSNGKCLRRLVITHMNKVRSSRPNPRNAAATPIAVRVA